MIETKKNFLELIGNKDWRLAERSLNDLVAKVVVRVLEDATKRQKIILFRLLTREQAKKVFKLLSHSDQLEIVGALDARPRKVANLLNDIEPDDRTKFLKELPQDVAQPLIQLLSPEERKISINLDRFKAP